MTHFSFTQICQVCKKSYKTFKIDLSNYDENGLFLGKKDQIYFVCCGTKNFVNFVEICNPFTIRYMRTLNEIEEVNCDLIKIRMEKLKITT